MKKLLLIVISILFIISTVLYLGITNELIVVSNEYGQGVKYNDEIQKKLIAQLNERNIKHIINAEGFITFRKKDEKVIKEIADQFMVAGSDNDTLIPSKPNTYFCPAGANEYFIDLLKNNEIPHYVDYDKNKEIKKISWDIENNRLALEQVLKVQEKIGQTKTPPSIKFLSPEMNDRFEKILEEKGIRYTRNGDYTTYEWIDWVEVEILKKDFFRNELHKTQPIDIKEKNT